MFNQETIRLVWQKAIVVLGSNATLLRKDLCGAWIKWNEYGNRDSDNGWEIDHIIPVADGGSDAINNLRPLHWKNNATKQDGKLTCPVTARVN